MFVPVFIKRVAVLSAALTAVAFLFLSVYYQFPFALAILLGGVWSSLNLLALTYMVQQLLRPTPIDWATALASIFIKLPLLYGAGFFLVTWDYLPKLGLVAGFSVVFAVIVLKGLGRMILKLDEKEANLISGEAFRA
ncbi:MAG: hypothetical protein L0Z48_09055 [candidate division Zixibacteria bacterium]|nr:hypothetical protein [candidate division Zixibacteria bacterium]MCI0596669.1 hypothetical protein [candidate division Zixibacteria bacterium]